MPMITMRRALRDHNAATAGTMVAISSTLVLLLGRVVTAMRLSLEAKLMAVSLVLAALYLLRSILVAKRRCSGHWLVQYGAMAAYYLPSPLVFYAASAVCYTSNIDEYTPWLMLGVLCMFFFSVPVQDQFELKQLTTNMRAYSLRDRPRGRYNFLMWLVFLGWLEWERGHHSLQFSSNSNWLYLIELFMRFGIHFCMLLLILSKTSYSTLDSQTKAVADYMKQRESSKSSSSPFFDDDANINSNSNPQLNCCRYPFAQRKDGEWVTVKDLVQQQQDDLPNEGRDDLPDEDRDIWLSYSLCRLLARRYYGFHCAEEGDDKVRRFALADLGRTNNGYKRAFTIVEVQLAFLHDYFFTASLPIIASGFRYIVAAQLLTGTLFAAIMCFFVGFRTAIPSMHDKPVVVDTIATKPTMLSLLLTSCVLIVPPLLLVQRLLAFYWRPIHNTFHKLNCLPDLDFTPNPAVDVVRFFRPHQYVFNLFQTGGAYWRDKIGQYSVLQDCDRSRSPKKAFVAWFQQTMLSEHSYHFIKHLPIEEDEVDMPKLDSMRELIANTLRDIDGPPTNGTRSLKINKDGLNRARKKRDIADYDLLWTCKQETHTDTILIWHIATCYCDMTPISDVPSEKRHRHHEAARALSRYCAYLVAFLPEFLPEHILTSMEVFQRVMQEAQQELGTKPMTEEEKVTKIRGLQLPEHHEQQTTFRKGVHLGRQLEMLEDDGLRWKVIAEFWAETILYVAPSDNAEAHIEHLAKGGEFITHLWAMLSNAGILKQAAGDEWHPPPASTTTEAPPKQDELRNVPFSDSDEASTSSTSFPPMYKGPKEELSKN